jgi:hypothetical protein
MIEPRHVTIAFSGQSSGRGPLSLGQDNMIRCTLENEPADINKQGAWPVPEGTTLGQAVEALRTLTNRHETLRTLYPHPAGSRPTEQVVRAEGEFEVDVVEAEGDAWAVAEEIGRSNRARRFDVAREFPLRLTLVTRDGVPVVLSAVVCHAAADGTATARLVTEWLELAAGHELPPPTGPTPRQVAADERSSAGLRRIRASLQHWERILEAGPHAVFADGRLGPSDATHTSFAVHSVNAAAALDAASRRLGTGPSTIMLAAYAALAAARADRENVVIAALSANRHKRAVAEYVGTVAQDALIKLETTAADFDELIARAGGVSMAAYWHSSFDSAEVWQLIDDVGTRRGARFARHLVLNDLSMTLPEALTKDLAAPPEDPHLVPLPVEPIPARLMLNIWRLSSCVSFTLHADRQLFTTQEAETFARGLVRLVCEIGERTVPLTELGELTGVHAVGRPGDWRLIGESWIDLAAVRELLETAVGKRAVAVEVEGGRLRARIGDDGGNDGNAHALTPREVHAAIVDVLFHCQRGELPDTGPGHTATPVSSATAGWETTMAPHHYVIHRGSPTSAERPADWARLPVLAEGDGRDQ